MNETQHDDAPPQAGGTPSDFDAHRLRTIADMRRSRDDRMLGGVCSGAAKYLNVDPVVLRVVIAVLTFVGCAGVILYVAAWFFLPSEDTEQSMAADWFRLDRNEEQVRIVGLAVAVVLAALAIVGDGGWWSGWGVPWILVPLAILYWFFVVRPRRRSLAEEPMTTETTAVPTEPGEKKSRKRARREAYSPALSVLTLSVAAIAVAVTMLVAQANDGADWTSYVAVGLGVVALGLLVSTVAGNGGPLVVVGGLLAVALAVGTLLPSPRIGQQNLRPTSASEVLGRYEHGIGRLELDLSRVTDPEQLAGSALTLENGVGQTKVIVPAGLNVAVDADLGLGEINAFDRIVHGTDNRLDYPREQAGQPALTLHIDQTIGNVEVVRR